MKLDNVKAIYKYGDKIYASMSSGAILCFIGSKPIQIGGIKDCEVTQLRATDKELIGLGEMAKYDNPVVLICKTTGEGKTDAGLCNFTTIIAPDLAVDNDGMLCRRNNDNYWEGVMAMGILDSRPLTFDYIKTTDSEYLAISRDGTIYTLDPKNLPEIDTFHWDGHFMQEVHQQMNNDDNENSNNDDEDNKSGIVVINYIDDFEQDEEEEKEEKAMSIFNSIIPQNLPITGHHPLVQLNFLKLYNREEGKAPLVVTAGRDHRFMVHTFDTHEQLIDTDWIDPFPYCGTICGNNAYIGCRDGLIVVMNLVDFTWTIVNTGLDFGFYEATSNKDKIAFSTTDNSVIILNNSTFEVLDAISVESGIQAIEMADCGLFVLDRNETLTIYQ